MRYGGLLSSWKVVRFYKPSFIRAWIGGSKKGWLKIYLEQIVESRAKEKWEVRE